MSKVESLAVVSPSPQYLAWLARERRGHRFVRAAQLAILVVFLVLWEVLPKALIVNPVLTSYPSALWPTFIELLKSTPQQASILIHTWATVLATILGFTGAMVLGTGVAAALWWWSALYKVLDPYLVVANAMLLPAARATVRELREATTRGVAPDQARLTALGRRQAIGGSTLHLVTVVLLVLMIWKPGS